MDERALVRRALRLARRGSGLVSPNPLVGAVVARGGRVVGEGFHRRFGGPHAEVEALESAGRRARGATLFVTLEPCSHHGKTPPCAEAVAASGIERVVASMEDPNPLVSGRGFAYLSRHGVRVEVGAGFREAREMNRAYLVNTLLKRPFVTLKTAQSIDGRIAGPDRRPWPVTSESARRKARRMRFDFDAVLVGINTVLADDPLLDYRTGRVNARAGKNFFKVVLDSRGRLPLDIRLWSGTGTIVALVSEAAPPERVRALERRGALVGVTGRERPEAPGALEFLFRLGVGSVMVEGGAEVAASFIGSGLVDEWLVFQAPTVMGGSSIPSVGGPGFAGKEDLPRFRLESFRRLGEESLVRYLPPSPPWRRGS